MPFNELGSSDRASKTSRDLLPFGRSVRREAAKLRQISLEYDAKARGLPSPPLVPALEAEPTAQQLALAILREFEQARSTLILSCQTGSPAAWRRFCSMICMDYAYHRGPRRPLADIVILNLSAS
jgi:hypothetical protein